MRCIYCCEEKLASAYRKAEHIVPQSFGRFKNNLTLHEKVCDDCNQALGDCLETDLARDSVEGLMRFEHGTREPSAYKGVGGRSRLSGIRLTSGELRGAYVAPSPMSDRFALKPIPQVGLLRRDNGQFDFFPIDKFPDRLDTKAYATEKRKSILVLCDPDEAITLLSKYGISLETTDPAVFASQDPGPIDTEITGTIDKVLKRAFCKIAFNYLAYWNLNATMIEPCFDHLRRYIRYAEQPPQPVWSYTDKAILGDEPPEGRRRLGHIVTVETGVGGAVVGQVALFNYNTYLVLLTPNCTNRAIVINKGHFWNVADMDVSELTRFDKR